MIPVLNPIKIRPLQRDGSPASHFSLFEGRDAP